MRHELLNYMFDRLYAAVEIFLILQFSRADFGLFRLLCLEMIQDRDIRQNLGSKYQKYVFIIYLLSTHVGIYKMYEIMFLTIHLLKRTLMVFCEICGSS